VTDKSVAQKAHVKPGVRIAVINGIKSVIDSLGLPVDASFVDPASAQLVFLFVNSRPELEALMPSAVRSLAPGAAIWVFFRKGSRGAGLDMSRNDVWAIAERMDMRPLGLVGVDETWSAFRLKPASG